jgi:hypothetical protein
LSSRNPVDAAMSSLAIRLSALVAALAVVAAVMPGALADDAKPGKHHHKKVAVAKRAKAETQRCRGESQFQCGPLYYNGDYMGDDPDPFIRSQIMRDVSGHYGGGEP